MNQLGVCVQGAVLTGGREGHGIRVFRCCIGLRMRFQHTSLIDYHIACVRQDERLSDLKNDCCDQPVHGWRERRLDHCIILKTRRQTEA